jgi:hypothetical protein
VKAFKTFAREIVALLSKSLDNFKVAVIKGKEAISETSLISLPDRCCYHH